VTTTGRYQRIQSTRELVMMTLSRNQKCTDSCY